MDRRFTNLETEFFRFEQLESSITLINDEFESYKSNLAVTKNENSNLKQSINTLKEAVIGNKCRSMRNNLLLHGVAEKEAKCEDVVRQFVLNKLDTNKVNIDR